MAAKAEPKSNRLQDALAAYRAAAGDRLDPEAAAVLDRLAGDERAAAAFAETRPQRSGRVQNPDYLY